MITITEIIDRSALRHRPHLAPGEPAAERDSYSEVVMVGRLREYPDDKNQIRKVRLLSHYLSQHDIEDDEPLASQAGLVGIQSLAQTLRAKYTGS